MPRLGRSQPFPPHYGAPPVVSTGTSATGAVTLGAQTASAAGTFAPGTKTGAAAAVLGPQTAAAVGSYSSGTETGAAAAVLGAQTAAAVGTFAPGTKTGAAAAVLGPQTAAAVGSFGAGSKTGAAAVVLGHQTAAAAGTFAPGTKTGAAAVVLGHQIAAALGSFAPGTKTGAAAAVLGGQTAAAAGSYGPGTRTAHAAATLGGLLAAAEGYILPPPRVATITVILGPLAAAAAAATASASGPGYDYNSRRGAGVEMYGSNYPFVAPSANARGLLADLWLAYEDRQSVPPLKIAAIYNIGVAFGVNAAVGTHVADLVITDADDTVICDTRTSDDYHGEPFGRRFFVHEWRFSDPRMVCRAVQHCKFNPEEIAGPFASTIVPLNGQLDERTYELLPRRLLEIQVGEQILSGDIVLQAGWNMEIATAPTLGFRLIDLLATTIATRRATALFTENKIQFSAVAGAGAGQFPGCADEVEVGLRTIDNVPPTAKGDFRLTGRDCIYVAPPYVVSHPTELVPSALQIGNDCTVCRDCDAYVDTYQELRTIRDQLNSDAIAVESLRDQYAAFLDGVRAAIAACVKPLSLSVTGGKDTTTALDTGVTYSATTVTITAQVTNSTPHCYHDVVLQLTMDFPSASGTPQLLHSGSVKTFDDGTSQPDYSLSLPNPTVTWDRIRPGASVRVHYAVIWAQGIGIPAPTGPITVTATATAGGLPLPLDGPAQTVSITEDIE